MFRRMNAAAMWHADHHRAMHATPCTMSQPAHVIHDLIDGRVDETHELDLGHRLHALCRQAHAHSRNHVFGKRGVLHAIGAEALDQSGSRAEYAATLADVLTQHDHTGIVFELPRLCHRNGFDHGNACHGQLISAQRKCARGLGRQRPGR
jgi:hypothetical protein